MSDAFETEKCVGCRSCELACSYHHNKMFWPAISSIEVKRWEKTGRFSIVLHQRDENGRKACDGCGFCVEFCPSGTQGELRAILEREAGQTKGAKR
jgi:ferredoxin